MKDISGLMGTLQKANIPSGGMDQTDNYPEVFNIKRRGLGFNLGVNH